MAHKRLRGQGKPKKASGVRQKDKSKVAHKKNNAKSRKIEAALRKKAEPAPEEEESPPVSAAAAAAWAAAAAARPAEAAAAPKQGVSQAKAKLDKREAKLRASTEKQHRGLYVSGERILLVGEGNFSFALALCRSLGAGAANVYATAFDGEDLLKRKYPESVEIRRQIETEFGATTLVGVDATRLHRVGEFRGAFAKIVWNFPHMGGGVSDVEKSIVDHRKLLTDFFVSAQRCLNKDIADASVHVALKAGEPYKSWKIVMMARSSCEDLTLQTVVPFSLSAFPGYAHRRTVGFSNRFSKADSEELAKGAKVYVFRLRKALDERDED